MLTVCIPYRERDALYYNRLAVMLSKYASGYPVEFMSLPNNGSRSIGSYRQQMLENVQTPYMTFIDADDDISKNYFVEVFKGIEKGASAVGFTGIITTNGTNPHYFEHSARHTKWFDRRIKGKIHYYRPINHLNPIKTEIALQIGYNDLKHAEDYDYSLRLSKAGLIKPDDEYFILSEPMYYYLYRTKK